MRSFRDIQVDETNILSWQGLIVPVRNSTIILILIPYTFYFVLFIFLQFELIITCKNKPVQYKTGCLSYVEFFYGAPTPVYVH